jgi:hypothetical protein
MRLPRFLVPLYVLTDWFPPQRAPNPAITASVFSAAVVLILLVAAGAYFDRAWILPPPSKGLAVHYGAWATLITDPLLAMSVAYAYRQFRIALLTVPIIQERESKAKLRRLVQPHLDFLRLRTKSFYLYILLVAIGFLSWLNNIYQTNDPTAFYGYDVFDSTHHLFGFAAHKLALFVSWVLIYPAVGFLNISMCVSTRLVLARLRQRMLIAPIITHPDGCYGLAKLGKLNISLLMPYVLTFAVIFALLITHDSPYLSAEIPLVALTAAFLVASSMTIQPIVATARLARHGIYRRLARESANFKSAIDAKSVRFGIERIIFGMTNGSPYTTSTQTGLVVMRLVPVVMTMFKIFDDHFR